MRVVFVGQDRRIGREIALAILTFGVRRRLWLYRTNREIDGHEALGLHHAVTAALLVLPILGPAIVTLQVIQRTSRMLAGSPVPYGRPGWVFLGAVVPLFGSILFFIPYQQSRLNRFWAHERSQRRHGVEVDVDVGDDPRFLIELGRALKESYYAGSRFEVRRKARRERAARLAARWREVRLERRAVREAGGTTPVLPWARPRRPPIHLLHVTCGACRTRFDVRRDPTADTPIVCPTCGRAEVLPSLHSDPLRGKVPAALPELSVSCPRCATTFHAVRNLRASTALRCPKCGHQDTLPPPGAPPTAGTQRRRKAERPETTRA